MVVKTTINNKWWWQLSSFSIQLIKIHKWWIAWILQMEEITVTRKFQKQLRKPNWGNKEPIGEQVILFINSMKTACLSMVMLIIKIWMLQSILIIIENDQFKEVQHLLLQMLMEWMLLWILALLLESIMVEIVKLLVAIILLLVVEENQQQIVLLIHFINQTNKQEENSPMVEDPLPEQ